MPHDKWAYYGLYAAVTLSGFQLQSMNILINKQSFLNDLNWTLFTCFDSEAFISSCASDHTGLQGWVCAVFYMWDPQDGKQDQNE